MDALIFSLYGTARLDFALFLYLPLLLVKRVKMCII